MLWNGVVIGWSRILTNLRIVLKAPAMVRTVSFVEAVSIVQHGVAVCLSAAGISRTMDIVSMVSALCSTALRETKRNNAKTIVIHII
jgi:hypothetical protein